MCVFVILYAGELLIKPVDQWTVNELVNCKLQVNIEKLSGVIKQEGSYKTLSTGIIISTVKKRRGDTEKCNSRREETQSSHRTRLVEYTNLIF